MPSNSLCSWSWPHVFCFVKTGISHLTSAWCSDAVAWLREMSLGVKDNVIWECHGLKMGSLVCSDPLYCWLDTCWSFKWGFQKVCLYLFITSSFLLFFSVQTLSCLCLNRATVELVKTGFEVLMDHGPVKAHTVCLNVQLRGGVAQLRCQAWEVWPVY